MGSLFKPSETTSTTTQSWGPPGAYQKAYKELLKKSQGIADTPYDPATERYGELTGAQQQAATGIAANQGTFRPYLSSAYDSASMGIAPITQQQIQERMSPYLQNVVDATQRQFDTQNARQMQDVNSRAAMQGALGGTRGNVAEALTREAQMNAQNPVIANLYSQGYNQAEQNAQADANRALQGANIMGGLGGMAQQYGYADVNALLGLGGLEREVYDINSANAQQRAGYAPGMANWAAGLYTSLGNAAGGTSKGTSTVPGPSMGQQLIGGATALAGLFSDERIKRDIEEIGKTHDGQSIYRYRMGDDPRMRIGLMAQEVEQTHPEAVGSVDGIKTVDYGTATENAVRPGYAPGGVVQPAWLQPMQAQPFRQQGGGGPSPSLAQASGGSGGLGALLDGVKQAHSAFGSLSNAMRTTKDHDTGWQTTVNPTSAHGWGNYPSNGLGSIGNMFGFSHGGPVRRGYEGGGVVEEVIDLIPDANDVWGSMTPTAATAPAPSPAPSQQGMGGFSWGLSDDVRRAMIAGGLGMMASRSPNLGVAIGEGGLKGVEAYDASIAARQAHEIRRQQVEAQAAALKERAMAAAEAANHRQAQLEETIRHNKATESKTTSEALDKTPEGRAKIAEQYGIDPNSDAGRAYILTGRLPREDQQMLTATDKKAILAADDMVATNKSVIKALDEAAALNDKANEGWFAGVRANIGNNLPDLVVPDFISSPESSEATVNLDNAVVGQALSQLKAVFGGNPTEGERKILLDLQGSSSQPKKVREEIFARAKRAAEARMAINMREAEQLRGGTYYKPGGGVTGGDPSIITITNDAEYDKLPSGTQFIGPDGQTRVKP